MEVDQIQAQPCKFPRIGNGGRGSGVAHNPDEEEDGRELKRAGGGQLPEAGGGNRLNGWHHSRIIRVSRASGGKDRHSKVWTSKGLRDRRVRLSVQTAIQFYDLQDRLGYDQPSKAVEWLIKAAADAIAELPSLNSSFPETPKQLSDEKRASSEHRFDSVELDADGDPNYRHQHIQSQSQSQNQHLSMSKSACSSTSETSKGSGLSLSRSEIRVNRVKARERARERAAKEKEKENNNSNNDESSRIAHAISQNASFTELLTGGIGSNNSPTGHQQNPAGGNSGEPILFHKAAPMDYFGSGLLGLSSSSATRNHHHSGFSGQIHLGNSLPQTMFSISSDHHNNPPEMQHFSFVPDYNPVSAAAANGGDYNLNFSMSSSGSLAGFNRGTLQSNSSPSPSLLPHLQRFSPIDGSSNGSFFIGGAAAAAAAAAAAPTMENHGHHHHHHHHHQFPAGLQLYGDGSRHSDHKGKAKN